MRKPTHRSRLGVWTQCTWAALAALLASLAPGALRGEDAVVLRSDRSSTGRSRLTGTVVDYTGRELVIEVTGGKQRTVPGRLVVEVSTEWSTEQMAGDQLYRDRQFASALTQYQAAARREERAWVRRLIMSRMIRCHALLDQWTNAGDLFLGLLERDPATPYFAVIPLAWLPAEASAQLERKAAGWMDQVDSSAAILLGASHLLSTSRRDEALRRLERVAEEKDANLRFLAKAQIWRATFVTAKDEELARWARSLTSGPEPLGAGPYSVLGRAFAQHRQLEAATVMFLRAALLYPEERRLAADGLFQAAEALEKLRDHAAATRLLSELVATYPESKWSTFAQEQLGEQQAGWSAPESQPPPNSTLDQRFLAALRQRRLFSLAENYCRECLANADLAEDQGIELTVELSRCFTEEALQSAPAARDNAWEQAARVCQEAKFSPERQPRAVLIQVQAGLVLLTHGELLRQEAELTSDYEQAFTASRTHLREAIHELKAALAKVGELLRQVSPTQRPAPGVFTNWELLSLQKNLNYQLARGYRNQGQSYAPQSADRLNSLRQAAELLSPLSQLDTLDPLAWPGRLDEITCLRLLGDGNAALRKLDLLEQQTPPTSIKLACVAERMRLALDQRDLADALRIAEQGRILDGRSSPQLDLAILETYLAAWRQALDRQQQDQAELWQARAGELVAEMSHSHGPYWKRRAESLLAATVSADGATSNLEVLVQAAEAFFRAGQIDQSLDAYDRVHEQAKKSGDPERAFNASYTAAVIEQDRRHFHEAATRFRALALWAPKNDKAAEAHLLAIYNTAQAARELPDDNAAAYRELLLEHVSTWPESPTMDQARYWLGQLHQHERAWPEAIAAYQGISPGFEKFSQAVQATSTCTDQWLIQLQGQGKSIQKQVAEAATAFEQLVLSADGQLPEHWTEGQCQAALGASALWLKYRDDRFDRVERILSAALEHAESPTPEWLASAQGLLAFALAGQGKRSAALAMLDQISTGPPQELLALLAGLDRMTRAAAAGVQKELAELQLRAAALLQARRNDLDADQQRTLDLLEALALHAAGRQAEARDALAKLAEENPRDGRIQEEHAGLLLHAADEPSWDAALKKFTEIQKHAKSGSARWFRAALGRADALRLLGRQKQAIQAINYTRGLYPELGGAEMKAQFMALLTRCQ